MQSKFETGKYILYFGSKYDQYFNNLYKTFEELKSKYLGITFLKYDIYKDFYMLEEFNLCLRYINPTFISIKDGKEMERFEVGNRDQLIMIVENLDKM